MAIEMTEEEMQIAASKLQEIRAQRGLQMTFESALSEVRRMYEVAMAIDFADDHVYCRKLVGKSVWMLEDHDTGPNTTIPANTELEVISNNGDLLTVKCRLGQFEIDQKFISESTPEQRGFAPAETA